MSSGGDAGTDPMPAQDLRAAEYALGTLDAEERSALEREAALDPGTAKRVVLRGEPGKPDDLGVIGTLLRADELGFGRRGAVDSTAARQITKALEQAGVRPPGRGRLCYTHSPDYFPGRFANTPSGYSTSTR